MILKDGTDTREEVARPGPFCDGMAVILDRLDLDGGWDARDGNEGDGSGAARFGHWVFWWDSNGFLSTTKHTSNDEADEAIAEAFPFEEAHDSE